LARSLESALKPRAGLFVTCLVDLMRPSIGFAAAKLIEASGCTLVVPEGQTCCGQPAYNSGDRHNARDIAKRTMSLFADCDYIVAPSGSCAAMLRHHVPQLMEGEEPSVREAAQAFAAKVHELTDFLVRVRGLCAVPGDFSGTITYHDACSGLRELGIKDAPRALLQSMPGVTLREMAGAEACCGFGGLFSEKYPGISNAIVTRKTEAAQAAAASLLVSGDLGCLMNIAGKLLREGSPLACRHVAEVLAGEMDEPPVGWPP
jgi:L-lactate dehydrogenase complex protein LldE